MKQQYCNLTYSYKEIGSKGVFIFTNTNNRGKQTMVELGCCLSDARSQLNILTKKGIERVLPQRTNQ